MEENHTMGHTIPNYQSELAECKEELSHYRIYGHKFVCPECGIQLTSLLLCGECGIRYELRKVEE